MTIIRCIIQDPQKSAKLEYSQYWEQSTRYTKDRSRYATFMYGRCELSMPPTVKSLLLSKGGRVIFNVRNNSSAA